MERELRAHLAERAKEHEVPGAAVGIYQEGSETYAVYGVTSLENPLDVDADTLFQFGSTGKTFTATTIMRLVHQGKIELDEKVRTYVPELKLKDDQVAGEVRVLNLLNHTAGWSGDFDVETGWGDDALAKFVEALANADQEFPLGKSVSYNNAALSLAGRVIEKVTGKPYEDAVKELVLSPLGMDQTFFFPSEVMTRRFVVGHTHLPNGTIEVARPWGEGRGGAPAGANISSNIGDQIKWAKFHLGDGRGADGSEVIPKTLLEQMQEVTVDTHGTLSDHVGISWMLEDVEGVRLVGHGGNTNGQQSAFEMVPERDFAVAVLTNSNPNGYQLHQEMVRWSLEKFLGLTRRDSEPEKLSEEQLTEYAGDYETVAVTVTLTAESGRLMMKIEAKSEEIESYPPFPLEGQTGKVDRVIVTEGPAKGLKGVFMRGDSGEIEGLHIGGRLATRIGR